MRKMPVLAATAASLVGLVSAVPVFATETLTTPPTSLVLRVKGLPGVQEEGTAIIFADGSTTKVTVALTGAATVADQPAELRLGSCTTPGSVKYTLSALHQGVSQTTISASFADVLAALPLALVVHTSLADAASVAACGNLKLHEEKKPTPNLTCMQTAVETRDNAILQAWSTYSDGVTAELTARKTAFKAAWGDAEKKSRRKSLLTAWETWRKSRRSASQTFSQAKRTAWKEYTKSSKACGVSEGAGDAGGMGADAQL